MEAKFGLVVDSLTALFFFTTVLCYEPEFLEPLENVTVTQGREATFTCVVDNLGGYKMEWHDVNSILAVNNFVLSRNNRISAIHSDHKTWELKIKNVTRNDSGQYMCNINTDPMKMQVGFLNVVIPPDIIGNKTSGDVMVLEGSTVKLTCRARGFPEPEYTWRREDRRPIVLTRQEQKKSAVYEFKGPELVFEHVARSDMGAYMCIASNDFPPSVSKRIVVGVYPVAPVIRISDRFKGARVGTDVTLKCEVEGSPELPHYWTVLEDDGRVIIERSSKFTTQAMVKNNYTTTMRLTIHSVNAQDFTMYSCHAGNPFADSDEPMVLYELDALVPLNSTAFSTGSTPGKLWPAVVLPFLIASQMVHRLL